MTHAPAMRFRFECRAPDGSLKWEEEINNLVTTAGKNGILDTYFKASGYTAAWYLGLKGSGSASASDTLASHAGWAEVTAYSGSRPAVTWGTTSSGSNTASTIAITLTGSATVAGAFVCTAASGTSGTLYNAADFLAPRSMESGDVLNVIPTVTMS